jgi:hypothetical protein
MNDGVRSPRPADGAAGSALAWLAHPASLIALAVLIVNDHVLKYAAPGVLTGKLSDVAGLVLAPPLLATMVSLLGRRLPDRTVAGGSIAAVGAGFTAAKATSAGATAAGAAWSVLVPHSSILVDPTDLVALPALGLAWLVWRRARVRPAGSRVVRLVRLCVVLPVMVFGVAATTQVHVSIAANVAEGPQGILYGTSSVTPDRLDDELRQVSVFTTSTDGYRYEEVRTMPPSLDDRPLTPESCRPSDPNDCYRVVPGQLAIEHRDGSGTWRMAWQISVRDQARLRAYYESYVADLVACRSLLVHETGAGAGYVVVAACGRDGFVRRGVDGVWERIGRSPSDQPVDPSTLPSPSPFTLGLIGIAVFAAILAFVVGSDRVAPRGRYRIATRILATLSVLLWLSVLGLPRVPTGLVALSLLGQFMLVGALIALHGDRRTLRWSVVLTSVVAGVAATVPAYLAYAGFVPPSWWVRPAVIGLAVAGAAAAAGVGRISRPKAALPMAAPTQSDTSI